MKKKKQKKIFEHECLVGKLKINIFIWMMLTFIFLSPLVVVVVVVAS